MRAGVESDIVPIVQHNLTFHDNSTQTVNITVFDDLILESNETFFATLSTTDGDVTISPTVAKIIIINDDGKLCYK